MLGRLEGGRLMKKCDVAFCLQLVPVDRLARRIVTRVKPIEVAIGIINDIETMSAYFGDIIASGFGDFLIELLLSHLTFLFGVRRDADPHRDGVRA